MLNIEQLKEDAALHRKAAEIWEEDRKSLLEDRAEKERLKLLDDEHKEAQRRWAMTQEQLLKERSDSNAQLQLGLQQLEQQQHVIEVHHNEKAQWLRQQEAHHAARSLLESRCNSLEAELNGLKQTNSSLLRDKEDLTSKLDQSEQDLAESGRHLAAARTGTVCTAMRSFSYWGSVHLLLTALDECSRLRAHEAAEDSPEYRTRCDALGAGRTQG